MSARNPALDAFERWYQGLRIHRPGGGPARGTIAAALVVIDRLKTKFDLNLDSHRAAGKSKIKGVGASALARILLEFGETRPFLKEGGRTNRGGPGDVAKMLDALRAARLDRLPDKERIQVLTDLQRFLVDKVREFHSRERLKVSFDPSRSVWQTIHDLLALARENSKEGPVAQYLVGAKLQLRFPETKISNESYSTADDQLGRPGDFHVGDTAFHVTVAPTSGVYDRCKRNLQEGLAVYLLVPDRALVGARQNAELTAPGQIEAESIESFVSQNVQELSTFSKNKVIDGFRHLLETYNQRVDAVENDKSMLIELPKNLLS